MDTEDTTPEVEATESSKPFIHIDFVGEGSADCSIHITGGISELQLFGVSEMLKQYAYDHMAAKTMERLQAQAAADSKEPQILIPRDHLGRGGAKRSN